MAASIVYERQPLPRPGQQASRGLWMVHVDGGTGVELTSVAGASWPSIDRGGRHLYFTRSTGSGGAVGYSDAIKGYRQVARYDLETGQIVPITSGTAGQQVRASSGGGYAAEVSPDGRYVAFARRIPDGLIEWKGHVYGPRTALWLRDLETGSERVLADPIESEMVETIKTLRPIPGYAMDTRQSSHRAQPGRQDPPDRRRRWVHLDGRVYGPGTARDLGADSRVLPHLRTTRSRRASHGGTRRRPTGAPLLFRQWARSGSSQQRAGRPGG